MKQKENQKDMGLSDSSMMRRVSRIQLSVTRVVVSRKQTLFVVFGRVDINYPADRQRGHQ